MSQVLLEFSDDVFSSLRRNPEEFGQALRLAAATHWYTKGIVSQEKAAQIAGLDRTDFLLALAQEQVDVFSVDMEDLKQALNRE
jgi:predicted HTH domain antitoxin